MLLRIQLPFVFFLSLSTTKSGFNNLYQTQDAIISMLMVLETKPLDNLTTDNLNLENKNIENTTMISVSLSNIRFVSAVKLRTHNC